MSVGQWLPRELEKVIADRPSLFGFLFFDDSIKLDNLVLVKDSCSYFRNRFSGLIANCGFLVFIAVDFMWLKVLPSFALTGLNTLLF